MFVTSFLEQIDVHLIAQYKLVTSVADAYCRRVNLVAVAYVNTVEIAAYKYSYRICRTI